MENEGHCDSISGNKNLGLEYDKETETCGGNDSNRSNGNVCIPVNFLLQYIIHVAHPFFAFQSLFNGL